MEKKEFNKSKKKIYKIICPSCKRETRHMVISSVDTTGSENMEYDATYYWQTDYQIIECQGCGQLSFRTEHTNSEDHDEEGNCIIEQLYPKRSLNSWNAKDYFNLPFNLRTVYRETIDCYNNNNLILCTAGIRALVEGLCKENQVLNGEIEYTDKKGVLVKKRKDNLQGKINGLYEKGILNKKQAESLHEHRFLGNDSVHELIAPTRDELILALTIIENVFDTLYEIPSKTRLLRNQRLFRKNKNSD